MPVTAEDLLKRYKFDPDIIDRVNHRKRKQPLAIVEPNPLWPQRFAEVKQRIQTALGATAVSIAHVGSTSVPGLAAKDAIDVDLTVQDVLDEASYVDQLTRAGFRLLFREPYWHQHRFFVEDWPGAFFVNLHVFGPDCPEPVRHQMFREWLMKTPADLKLYEGVKREASTAATAAGETTQEYNWRKEKTIEGILLKAFRDKGYIGEETTDFVDINVGKKE